MRRYAWLIAALLGCQFSMAQPKYEQEYRISAEKVPAEARSFVAQTGWGDKIKWYREEGLEASSVEAKIKHAGERYSIEFGMEGELQDVEILIEAEEIPTDARKRIEGFFQEQHDKYRYRRIQRQLSGPSAQVLAFLQTEESSAEVVIGFEIVVKTRTGKQHEMIEYLFSEGGEVLRTSPIVLRRTDHLEF